MNCTAFGLMVALPVVVVQSAIDLFLWGRPFAELTEYVLYNMANTTTYFDQPEVADIIGDYIADEAKKARGGG